MAIENAQIYSKGGDYQAIVDGKYYRTVNFNNGFGPRFVYDSEPTPERIKARVEGWNYHTFIGLEQLNPVVAASLAEAIRENTPRYEIQARGRGGDWDSEYKRRSGGDALPFGR